MDANLQTSTKRLSIGNFLHHKRWFEQEGYTEGSYLWKFTYYCKKIIMGTMQCTSQINFGFYETAHLHLSYPNISL